MTATPQTTGQALLEWCKTEASRGVREQPAGSNSGPRVQWYQAACDLAKTQPTGWAWCVAFVQRGLVEIGRPLAYRTASVGELLRWGRAQGWEVIVPKPGDIVCLDFDDSDGPRKGDWPDHVEVCSKVEVVRGVLVIHTIGGNTGSTNWSNGGCVMPQTRFLRQVEGFLRLPGVVPRKPLIKPTPVPVGPPKQVRWEIVDSRGKPVAWNKDLAALIKWQAAKQARRLGSITIRKREV